MKPGDIVLIRFPHADLQAGKLRPALVVAIAPDHYKDVLLVLISSRIQKAIPEFDVLLNHLDSDFETTGLKVSSVIRLSRLATIESTLINAHLGNISSERLSQVKKRLITWLQS